MSGPPPPPPPHGGVPKGSGLPPGKYDIFVIPEHSAGGGFLYLPSMQPNVNSFAAGFASALILVVLGQTLAPAFRTWWEGFHGLGNMAMAMLVVGVGFGAWALGRFQNQDKGFPGGGGFSGPGNSGRDNQGGWSSGFRSANAGAPPPPPPHGTPPPPPPHHDTPPRPPPHDGPKTSWQSSPNSERPPPPPQPEPQPTPRDEPEPPPRPPPQARPPPPQTPPETPPPKPKSKKSKSKPKEPPKAPPREPSPPPKARPETPPPPPKPKAKPEPKPEPEPEPEPEPAPAPKAAKPEPEKQKGSWEKAREEMRKKEEERKIREAELKRREEASKRLAELRAKDAKERQEREKERQRKEQEAREKKERLEVEQRAKELAIKLEEERKERERLEKEAKEIREREAQREKEARELEEKKKREAEEREARRKKFAAEREALRKKEAEEAKRREEEKKQKELEKQREQERLEKEKAEKERIEKEKAEKEKAEQEQAERERAARETADRQRMSYAYSGGEKISMWPNGRPPAAPKSTTSSTSKPPPSAASSQRKPGPVPSATKSNVSGVSTENSYRPYDKPKQPKHRGSMSSLGSESSWAASQTTGRTTPPPSTRAGPYSTKDPDKIVISGVYLFMNQFAKTPASQLISGVGTVTDGLILRVTTEGLFIDDDVRNVPQREWDVKTWTLKQVEVWCPPHCLKSPTASSPAPGTQTNPLLYKMASSRARDRGATQPLVGEEADVYLTEMLRACKTCCRLGLCNRKFRDTNIPSSTGQTGEWKSKGLHLLRATNREGKRYLFVIDESESWKISTGLQRLRKSPLAQQLAVSGMMASDARGTLEMLGWA
ncbi:hypothetical protein IL306_009863 [Fusarium sp. DS 682]|nr:hypothetical protein IL306_009863 [Fusarium sp. DS 682]